MKELWKATQALFTGDATLVALVEHAVGDIRIFHAGPDVSRKVPSLSLNFIEQPLPTGARRVRQTVVQAFVAASTVVIADQIIERVRDLLAPASPTASERWHGPDFSDASVGIQSAEVNAGIDGPVFVESLNSWRAMLEFTVLWYLK